APLPSSLPLSLTVLCYTRNVQDPCESLEEFLTSMGEKLNSLNGSKRSWLDMLTLPALFDQPVYCKVCRDSSPIDRPFVLIAHITSKTYIEKACRFGGTASLNGLNALMCLLEN
ncbi:hypothetical protein PENTCL1PPCAC_8062, partial [Pristionchus entomophagus]